MSKPALARIAEPGAELFFSHAGAWELAIKFGLGKLQLPDPLQAYLDNSPFICKADELAELAERMKVDVPTFLDTVQRYNKACEQGLKAEAEFGKPLHASKPFDTPPYYAVQLFPLARKNFGGVKTTPWPSRIVLVTWLSAPSSTSGAEQWENSCRKWCSVNQT